MFFPKLIHTPPQQEVIMSNSVTSSSSSDRHRKLWPSGSRTLLWTTDYISQHTLMCFFDKEWKISCDATQRHVKGWHCKMTGNPPPDLLIMFTLSWLLSTTVQSSSTTINALQPNIYYLWFTEIRRKGRERQTCSPDMSSTKQTLITQRQMLSDQTGRNEIMHEMK